MMKNRIKNLNVRAKKYETNHSVKLMVDGIGVSAMFDCFTVCSLEEVEFVVVAEDKQTSVKDLSAVFGPAKAQIIFDALQK